MITDGARPVRARPAIHKAIIAGVVVAMFASAIPLQAAQTGAARSRQSDERSVAACIKWSAGGRAWLEKTLWGLRDQEGGWIGAEIANGDGSHDLGPLQVNSRWASRLAAITGRPEPFIRYWLKADPCFNVDAARWIFLSGLAVTRDYWKAVGNYHSPTGWRQRRYSSSVAAHLKRRFGERVFGAK